MIKWSFLTFLFLFTSASALAQNHRTPFITTFSSRNYNASQSNWQIIQDRHGIIFSANFEGLLTNYSNSWRSTPIDGLLSAYVDPDNRIYYGTINDFGYFGTSKRGELIPNSLVSKKEVGPIWSVIMCFNNISFFSQKTLFLWDGFDIRLITPKKGEFKYNQICSDELYTLNDSSGLMQITNNEITSISGTSDIASDNLTFLEKPTSDSLLIHTRRLGQFNLSNGNLIKVNSLNLDGSNPDIFSLVRLQNQKNAIATPDHGLIITDNNLEPIKYFNKGTGFISNTIKTALESRGSIWTATQDGIAQIEYNSPILKIEQKLFGTITSLAIERQKLIIASREGLFSLDSLKADKLEPIFGWHIFKIKNDLLISADDGIYSKSNNVLKKISFYKFGLIGRISNHKMVVCHKSGITLTDNNLNEIVHFETGARTYISTQTSESQTFISTKFHGVYEISSDSGVFKLKLYNQNNGLPDTEEIHVFKHLNQPLFTTSKGLYKYVENNPDSAKFVPYQGNLNPQGHVKQAVQDSAGNYYFTIQDGRTDRLEKFELQSDGSYKRVYKPYKRLPPMEITALLPDKDSVLWIAGTEGLFRFDGKVKKDYNLPFHTLISKVQTNDSLIHGGFYSKLLPDNKVPIITQEQPEDKIPELSFENNDLTFNYAAAFYEAPKRTTFSYYLVNNDEGWSNWSLETKKEYTNLPAGDYTFMVKAKNIYDTEGSIASYQFSILPPWYQTTWAYIGFTLLSILFVWFISLAYTYRVRMQRRKLKLIVADRTFEVISQKKEIEKQNQLLKTQYGEISSQKDEIEMKNSELQQSQEEILTINEKLKELNSHLEKKVEQRTQKIKATLIKLKKTNKELDTFIYRASHDLKGPISRIHGLTSLAKLETKDASNNKYYDLIEHAALDMQGLLSKLSHAYEIMNKEVVIESIDIPFLLSEIRNSVKFLDKETKYSFDIQEKLSVRSDKYLLKIILENVIENALIFRKKDSEHQVSIHCYEKDDKFYFQIADNGIGVNPDHFKSIFEMFFRGSDQSKGSGLGLYITSLALEKMNGSINVESTLYQYSKFTITIPIQ